MKPTLVTSYVNPDLDGVAGCIAYAELLHQQGKEVEAAFIGDILEEAQYMFHRFRFPLPKIIRNSDAYDEVILVDSSHPAELEGNIPIEKVVEIIDHRKVHGADQFPHAKVYIELVGAAATLITEKFMHVNQPISVQSATLLYGAIISGTLNFKGSHSTDRDHAAAEWLNKTAKLDANFWKDLFLAKSDLTGDKLPKILYDDAAWLMFGGKQIGIAQIEMIGSETLLQHRMDEIIKKLTSLKKEKMADYIFLNLVDLEDDRTLFVTDDSGTQELLTKTFLVSFTNNTARLPRMMLRKQIIPHLKEVLEKQ